jgi:hypothetical protein
MGTPFFYLSLFFKLKILPLATRQTVNFFRRQEPFFRAMRLGIELHKLSLIESVKSRKIGTHTVSGKLGRIQMEGERFAVSRSYVGKALTIERDFSTAYDFRRLLVF